METAFLLLLVLASVTFGGGLMVIGLRRKESKRIRQGFVTLMVAAVSLGMLALASWLASD